MLMLIQSIRPLEPTHPMRPVCEEQDQNRFRLASSTVATLPEQRLVYSVPVRMA